MEKMRVILITQFLFIAVVVAVQADVGKTITPELNPLHSQTHTYESPRYRKAVTHCTAHGAKTCWGTNAGIRHPHRLAHCLFNSMERCLKHHEAVLDQTIGTSTAPHLQVQVPITEPPPNRVLDHPYLIEASKFQTILKTCTHVGARSCWSGPNVATSVFAACLIPSMNQCLYPYGVLPLPPAADPGIN